MGIELNPYGKFNYNLSHTYVKDESYNVKVALWQVPHNRNYTKYDQDNSKWFESINKYNENEIENAEKNLKVSLNKYKVLTKTITYNDGTKDILSKYPNGNITIEHHGKNHVFVNIKDKNNQLVAEKIYGHESSDGRKIIYKHIKQGEDTFTIVRVFKYNTNNNRKTDIVNYGYTSSQSSLTDGCELETEYYLLNGKDVKPQKTGDFEFVIKNKNGKELKFKTE